MVYIDILTHWSFVFLALTPQYNCSIVIHCTQLKVSLTQDDNSYHFFPVSMFPAQDGFMIPFDVNASFGILTHRGINEINIIVQKTCQKHHKFSLKFVLKCPVKKSALIQIMAWHQTNDKTLTEPLVAQSTDASKHHQTSMSKPDLNNDDIFRVVVVSSEAVWEDAGWIMIFSML